MIALFLIDFCAAVIEFKTLIREAFVPQDRRDMQTALCYWTANRCVMLNFIDPR
jgi:hypothetical protein